MRNNSNQATQQQRRLNYRLMREQEMITLTKSEWQKLKHRNDIISKLAVLDVIGQAMAQEAAEQLGTTKRWIYKLIQRYKAGSGLVTDLRSRNSNGGKNKSRISPEVNIIINEAVSTLYLSRQKLSKAVINREIRMRCRKAGLRPPAYNTIDLRITQLDPLMVATKRHGSTKARKLQSVAGETPEVFEPLEKIQMDHTDMDVIVVDETERRPIGRPSLTLAIDEFTRCIVGMLLTLEAPSATSVGLCLAHVVSDKSVWLEKFGMETGMWPMHGKPKKLYVDNGSDFHSEALQRGCDQHGICLEYRPEGQPQFGGIIERVIGTAMNMAHGLPGTTFSNVQERGTYKSEKQASLTLKELEKWLILAVGTYHGSVHDTLLETPLAVWNRSVQTLNLEKIPNRQAFLIDFLPVIRRSITRTGFVIDHIWYWSDSLKPWVSRRESLGKFIIRRDPRDISRVWVLDPESRLYFEIPYRSISRPAVTLWEHKQALDNLRKQGREQFDEAAIFCMIEQMREITETAVKERKRARRDKSRRAHLSEVTSKNRLEVPKDKSGISNAVKPFEIEEW